MKRTWIVLMSLCVAPMVEAQTVTPPADAPAKPVVAAPVALPPAAKFGSVVFNASIRTRLEAWDWFTPSTGDNTYAFSGNIARLSLSQTKEKWDWNAEFEIGRAHV